MVDSPLRAHAATPQELRERIEAERAGVPFLLLRDGDGDQHLVELGGARVRLSIGRSESNDVPLPWDEEVSRLHAELEAIAGQWTVSDDGLSRNGTYLNGARVSGRQRLRDGDVLRVGRTSVAFRSPASAESRPTRVGDAPLTLDGIPAGQRRVLVALARPYKFDEFATPATNQDVAEEVHLTVDAVKAQLRALYQRFGIEQLPQNQKRARLVAEAFHHGVVTARDL